ncbi:hypothetical protein OFO10_06055 [Campylobacter sp. VBCF_06 NA8]|uniref:hypothetical protein n=1 Tax=Campylobacter sp. VBCF_06 NA8 TaxID=2983822 RepID=UPI0022E9C7EC|nr:hypothetical protein [Campylobacter sp. VBCF_06 NA8]MDA3046718.1 hypothetical protein [Campylobacter sp. VBCF_06 NA8]
MPRPPKVDYAPIVAEYQAGLCSISELAKKYKCNRTALYDYIRKNNIKINDNIKNGVSIVEQGLELLQSEKTKTINDKINDKTTIMTKNALMKGFEHIALRHGVFGEFCVSLVQKGLQKGDEILSEVENARDFKSAMSGIKDGLDILGVFPKTPAINLMQTINGDKDKLIEVEFIDAEVVSDEN